MNALGITKFDECTLRDLRVALDDHNRKCWMCAGRRGPCSDAREIQSQICTLERILKARETT